MDGIVHTYKARLVAKGYTQLYGVDYEEKFSHVADIRAIRILISIATFYDYEIWQMDVKTAFLNGYFDEDISMIQPEGFVDPNHPRKVCNIQRFIYGIKQASRSWNKRFDEEIKRYKMDNSKRGHIPMHERLDLNKTQGASTPEENHGELHWTAVKNILKYLGNTKDMFLVYGGNLKAKLQVDFYCNAGFETDIDDMKSLIGYVFVLNGSAVD
ncbi:retrotransposon protein, putative, ty1-copia subclass [Tanacetum coccineum]